MSNKKTESNVNTLTEWISKLDWAQICEKPLRHFVLNPITYDCFFILFSALMSHQLYTKRMSPLLAALPILVSCSMIKYRWLEIDENKLATWTQKSLEWLNCLNRKQAGIGSSLCASLILVGWRLTLLGWVICTCLYKWLISRTFKPQNVKTNEESRGRQQVHSSPTSTVKLETIKSSKKRPRHASFEISSISPIAAVAAKTTSDVKQTRLSQTTDQGFFREPTID